MILIVDGYNVLKKSVGSSVASARERDNFIKNVTRYAHAKNHTVIIVFDGGASPWIETFSPSTQTKIIYVGHGKSADDYIKEYLDAYKNEDIALVSSDRELNRFAEQRSLPSVEARAFMDLVQEVVEGKDNARKGTSSLHKMSPTHDEALDELMAELEPEVKKEEGDKESSSKKNMSSKKERFLLKKIKKL